MSYCYDTMRRVFETSFAKGDQLSMEFSMLIDAMHSANHRLQDGINKDRGVTEATRSLEETAKEATDAPVQTDEELRGFLAQAGGVIPGIHRDPTAWPRTDVVALLDAIDRALPEGSGEVHPLIEAAYARCGLPMSAEEAKAWVESPAVQAELEAYRKDVLPCFVHGVKPEGWVPPEPVHRDATGERCERPDADGLTIAPGPHGCTLVMDDTGTTRGIIDRDFLPSARGWPWVCYFDGDDDGPHFLTREDAIEAVRAHVRLYPDAPSL